MVTINYNENIEKNMTGYCYFEMFASTSWLKLKGTKVKKEKPVWNCCSFFQKRWKTSVWLVKQLQKNRCKELNLDRTSNSIRLIQNNNETN